MRRQYQDNRLVVLGILFGTVFLVLNTIAALGFLRAYQSRIAPAVKFPNDPREPWVTWQTGAPIFRLDKEGYQVASFVPEITLRGTWKSGHTLVLVTYFPNDEKSERKWGRTPITAGNFDWRRSTTRDFQVTAFVEWLDKNKNLVATSNKITLMIPAAEKK